jgi:hypothetical protein
LPAPTFGRLATIVLVVALFVCHGVYGFEHQLGIGPETAHSTQPDPMTAHHTMPDKGDTGHGAASNGGYFAVLIPLLLAAVLWLWRGSFRIPAARGSLRFRTRAVTPLMPHPPRGPTLYVFQVMRL